MIGLFLQSWWLVQICRASDWSISLEPVIGPFLEGQRSDQFYTTNDWSISLGPVIGLFLKGQRSVHFYRASNGSIPISLGTDRFSSLDINCDTLTFTRITTHLLWHKSLHTYLDINHHTLSHDSPHTYLDITCCTPTLTYITRKSWSRFISNGETLCDHFSKQFIINLKYFQLTALYLNEQTPTLLK